MFGLAVTEATFGTGVDSESVVVAPWWMLDAGEAGGVERLGLDVLPSFWHA